MRGGPGVIVTGVLMTVDSQCSVAISSLSEGECLPHDPSTEPRATDDTTKYGSSQGSTDNILVYEQLNGNRLTSGAGTLVSSALATMRGLNEQQQHEYTFSHPSGTPALHSLQG